MRFMVGLRVRIALVICGALALAVVAYSAQDAKPAGKKEDVTINGDQWKWHGGEGQSTYTITGNIVVKHLDTTVTADRAEYNEKTKIIVTQGNLKIVDADDVITGEKATTSLSNRKSLIEGNVKLISHPKPAESAANGSDSPRAKLHEPATVTCDRLEYRYRDKIATADGNLKIVQKGRTLVSQKCVYDLKQEVVALTGGVSVTDEDGQAFTCPGTATASLKEGSEWIQAEKASATLKVDLDEELGREKPAPETPEKKPENK